MSCQTSTWPSVSAPAPMPIVGTVSARVIARRPAAGTASSTIAKQPAASSASASSTSCCARSARAALRLEAAEHVAVCGVRPTWPITGMPASTIARARETDVPPPSSLTASAPPSLTRRTALLTACSSETWYEPNGMSATTSGRFAPRVTHCVMNTISSIVTGTVESRPCTTMPAESPTRIEVDAGGVGEAAARRVVGGDHHDLVAAPLHLGELGQRQLAGRPGGVALGLRLCSCELSFQEDVVDQAGGADADGGGEDVGVVEVEHLDVVGSRPLRASARAAARDRRVARRPARARAAGRARARAPAAERRPLREESARPSASRTVGTTRISSVEVRSRTSRRITATCCASFWPK